MNVAVFGAAGWVGRAVLHAFSGRHLVRAFDHSPAAWDVYRRYDGDWDGQKVYGEVADFSAVDRALEGMEGVVNLAAYFGYQDPPEDNARPFLVNLKGMWNILESARRRKLRRVVQMGSCVVQHPDGLFLSSEVRSKEGSLYGITKRLRQEMCRQYHDAYGLRIIVFRPCSIGEFRPDPFIPGRSVIVPFHFVRYGITDTPSGKEPHWRSATHGPTLRRRQRRCQDWLRHPVRTGP